ncbi:MAG: hypothetical protein ACSLEN_01140 [Candidatus Malihini olakiniferum]
MAQQSGVLLSYDPTLAEGKQSSGLQGLYEVEQGLRNCLLTVVCVPSAILDGSISVVAQHAAQTTAAVPAYNVINRYHHTPNTALKLDVQVSETPRAMSVVTQQQMGKNVARRRSIRHRYSPPGR